MKQAILLLFLTIFTLQTAVAQTAKEADPKDVASLDAIMKAIYDVISGDAGKPRDWDRFRALFHKDARLIPSGKNPPLRTGLPPQASLEITIRSRSKLHAPCQAPWTKRNRDAAMEVAGA